MAQARPGGFLVPLAVSAWLRGFLVERLAAYLADELAEGVPQQLAALPGPAPPGTAPPGTAPPAAVSPPMPAVQTQYPSTG